MRIAWIVPGGVDKSGRVRVIPVLLALLRRVARLHTLHVFALHQYPQPCRYSLLGATVHNLGWGLDEPWFRGARWWGRVHTLAGALRRAGPFDLVHGFWADRPGLLAAAIGRWLRVPSVVSLMGGELVALPDIRYGGLLGGPGRARIALALRLAARVTVATRYMQGLLRPHRRSAAVLPLGIEPEWFLDRASAADGPPWRLLYVGSLNRVKDLTTLLHALRRVIAVEPETRLDIIGEDTLGGELQRLCTRLELDGQVSFHGFIPNRELGPWYARAHLLALPSRHDAAPVVVLEAAACRLATIGTAVGYVADWSPERAWAIPADDPQALAEGVVALLRDPARRARLGRKAYQWARQHDADWTANRFECLYRRLAEHGPG